MRSMNNTTTTTLTPFNPQHGNKSTGNRRRRNIIVAACALTVLAISSCSAAQRRELGEMDVHESLESHLEQAVNDQSLSVSTLDCTSHISLDSHVSAECIGTVSSGEVVSASYNGTADVDDETCTAVLVVAIAGDQVIDQPYVQCFDTA